MKSTPISFGPQWDGRRDRADPRDGDGRDRPISRAGLILYNRTTDFIQNADWRLVPCE